MQQSCANFLGGNWSHNYLSDWLIGTIPNNIENNLSVS